MDAKEKAKELVGRFNDIETDVWNGEWAQYDKYSLTKEAAKECAIICVDEIISQLALINNQEGFNVSNYGNYWQSVKKEIQLL